MQYRKFDDIIPLLCVLCVHTPCFSCNNIHSEVRWPQWPILLIATTNPSVREVLIQVLRHVSTVMLDAPSSCEYVCTRVLCRSDHLEFLSAAPLPLSIGREFIRHFWLVMPLGVRSWSIDVKSPDTLYILAGQVFCCALPWRHEELGNYFVRYRLPVK
jgi:hypothetical protein